MSTNILSRMNKPMHSHPQVRSCTEETKLDTTAYFNAFFLS